MNNNIDDLKLEYESNKSKFIDDNKFKWIYGYEIQRSKGKYNPFTDGYKIMPLIECSDPDDYFDTMINYRKYLPKYFPEYCKKYIPELVKSVKN